MQRVLLSLACTLSEWKKSLQVVLSWYTKPRKLLGLYKVYSTRTLHEVQINQSPEHIGEYLIWRHAKGLQKISPGAKTGGQIFSLRLPLLFFINLHLFPPLPMTLNHFCLGRSNETEYYPDTGGGSATRISLGMALDHTYRSFSVVGAPIQWL